MKEFIAKNIYALSVYYKWKPEDSPDISRSRFVYLGCIFFTIISIFLLFDLNLFFVIRDISKSGLIRLMVILLLISPFYYIFKMMIPDEFIIACGKDRSLNIKKIGYINLFTLTVVFILDFILIYLKAKSRI
jgi:hypothetical protein